MIKYTSIKPECDPFVGSASAAGLDLKIYLGENARDDMIAIRPGETKVLRTGVAFEIPELWCGLVAPRSSTGKLRIQLENTIGVIDADYQGDIS